MVKIKLGNWSFAFGSGIDGKQKRPLALIILAGWGHLNQKEGNAIALANTPNYDRLCAKYPRTLLAASGTRVGLAPTMPGNSKIGNLNLGMGRVAQTNSARISKEIRSGDFFTNKTLKKAFSTANKRKSSVHLIGLISDGDVHSSMGSIFALLKMAKESGNKDRVFIHGILDGQDSSKHLSDVYLEALQIKMAEMGCGEIATLCGRDYAMDNVQNWERTARAYTMLVHSDGERALDPIRAIQGSFLRGNSDESIQPIVLERESGQPIAQIRDKDIVIFFNHRADGMKQLVKSLAVSEFTPNPEKPQIDSVCLTEYDKEFNLPVAFEPEKEANVLTEVFANNGIKNYRFAETEKYADVTSRFDGGKGSIHPDEKTFFAPSLNISKNGAKPESACFNVTDKFIEAVEQDESDVFIVNLAAADLFANTGNLEKTIEAVQFVDICLGAIIAKINEVDGVALITSDHSACEEMLSKEVSETAQSSNPVPFHVVANGLNGLKLRDDGALEDVAPTILGILGIEKPNEMTGDDLRKIGTF